MPDRKRLDTPGYDWQSYPWPEEIFSMHSNDANLGGEGSPLNITLSKLVERTDWLMSRCTELQAAFEAYVAGGGGGAGAEGGIFGGEPPVFDPNA